MFIQTKCNELSFADLIRATKDTIDESKKFPYKTFVSRCGNCQFCYKGKCSLKECCCKIAATEKRLAEIKSEVAEKKAMSDGIIPAYRQFRTWASEFEEASIEAKKMIVNELFSRIELGKGYKIRYVMNFTYKQFCDDWMTLDKKINASA